MHRKSNRLSAEVYQYYNLCYLTINCFNRFSYFKNYDLINDCLEVLKLLRVKFKSKIWAYCFMPNHLHLLIENDRALEFLKLFKQLTSYHFKQKSGQTLWQKSFYDHIVRREESLTGIMSYIFNNPVRGGLAKDFLKYPYSGSFEIAIADFMEA